MLAQVTQYVECPAHVDFPLLQGIALPISIEPHHQAKPTREFPRLCRPYRSVFSILTAILDFVFNDDSLGSR